MQRNSVTALRPAPGMWGRLRELEGVNPGAEAAYGCVDWYLYHDAALNAHAARGELGGARERGTPARPPPAEIFPSG